MSKKKIGAIACAAIGVLAIIVGLILPSSSKTYKVSFDSDGGSLVETQEIKENGVVSIPQNPTKDNYDFVRWEKDNIAYDFSSKVKSDITLKAIWSEKEETSQKYKVTLKLGDETKEIDIASLSELSTENLGFKEKDGYEIKWYLDGKEVDLNMTLTEDINLDGKYVKVSALTVKFDSKGGTKVNSQSVKSGEKVSEPTNVTYEGFIFNGWYLNNTKFDFNTPITKSITLIAKWEEDPNVTRYTVKFDSDGGSNVASQRVIENKQAVEPKKPTKNGYKFVEWDLDNKKYDFKTKVTKDITLKAKWEEDIQFTVTFNTDGGSKIEAKKVKNGEKVAKPANPTKNGYEFVEWLYENRTFNFSTPITKDITLTARYQVKTVTPTPTPTKTPETTPTPTPVVKYTVTFDSNGGSNVSSQSIESGKTASAPSNPTRSGYDFVEWQLNDVKYSFSTPVTKSITLKAIWKLQYYFKVVPVDDYSPDRMINVYDGTNKKITFSSITFNGMTISGNNPTVNKFEIEGVQTISVKLTDGNTVNAKLS